MTFDDGRIEIVTPKYPNLVGNFYREISFDPLEEFSGFGGVGRGDINYGCDTDGLYVWAYKKCPLVPIIPPDLSSISSESIQMKVLFDEYGLTIDLDGAKWTPLLWTDCGNFFYELQVFGPNPSLVTLQHNKTLQLKLQPSLNNSDAGIYNLTILIRE